MDDLEKFYNDVKSETHRILDPKAYENIGIDLDLLESIQDVVGATIDRVYKNYQKTISDKK